jgi:hypothetical protein
MENIKIILPLTVVLERKTKADKKMIINLNNYPHWHFITYNEIKKSFKDKLSDSLDGLKLSGPIEISYKLFKGSKRKSDRANVLAVQDKFFCDALAFYGCIDDDNDDVIVRQIFESTEIDLINPRVEAIITCDRYEYNHMSL